MPLDNIRVLTAGVSQIRLVKSTTALTPMQQQQLDRINQTGQISSISGSSGQLTSQVISGDQGIAGKTYQLIQTTAGMGLLAISPSVVEQKSVSFDL